jgi:chromosome segregation ATPase
MGDKYIQNLHNAPIKTNARDNGGKVIFTKKFMPPLTEKWSGKVLHTGYEKLTEEEYKQLSETSKTFKHFSRKLKLLVVHDDMPSDLKTPHEALLDARKESKKLAGQVKALEGEVTELKAKLLDAEEKYKQLSSASTDAEKFKSLNDQIASLTAERDVLKKAGSVGDKTNELLAAGEGFVAGLVSAQGKNKVVLELTDKYKASVAEIMKVSK